MVNGMRVGAAFAVWILFAASARCAELPPRRVKFAPGRSSALIKGSVVRGTVDQFVFAAKGGQRIQLRVVSTEHNAVITVYPPNSHSALPGTDEGSNAMKWKGGIKTSGDYTVRVSSTRGNASYTLSVFVK